MNVILALFHRLRTKHSMWSQTMFWPGGSGLVWFCDCGEQFWPNEEGVPNWRDNPVRRERPR
ncbi:hypothetical protein [Streptomyces chartreusis]|uniref:hypothetical protein n=1 Tax=Streptomyces chartreusis TaxID=1969 RepID=UPI0033D59922